METVRFAAVPAGAALLTFVLWRVVAEGYLFRPDLGTTLLGYSLTANVFLAVLLTRVLRRRAGG